MNARNQIHKQTKTGRKDKQAKQHIMQTSKQPTKTASTNNKYTTTTVVACYPMFNKLQSPGSVT